MSSRARKSGKDAAALVSGGDRGLKREMRDRNDLRAADAGAVEVRNKGAIPWRKVKRDVDLRAGKTDSP
jgi:hypothetical protein